MNIHKKLFIGLGVCLSLLILSGEKQFPLSADLFAIKNENFIPQEEVAESGSNVLYRVAYDTEYDREGKEISNKMNVQIQLYQGDKKYTGYIITTADQMALENGQTLHIEANIIPLLKKIWGKEDMQLNANVTLRLTPLADIYGEEFCEENEQCLSQNFLTLNTGHNDFVFLTNDPEMCFSQENLEECSEYHQVLPNGRNTEDNINNSERIHQNAPAEKNSEEERKEIPPYAPCKGMAFTEKETETLISSFEENEPEVYRLTYGGLVGEVQWNIQKPRSQKVLDIFPVKNAVLYNSGEMIGTTNAVGAIDFTKDEDPDDEIITYVEQLNAKAEDNKHIEECSAQGKYFISCEEAEDFEATKSDFSAFTDMIQIQKPGYKSTMTDFVPGRVELENGRVKTTSDTAYYPLLAESKLFPKHILSGQVQGAPKGNMLVRISGLDEKGNMYCVGETNEEGQVVFWSEGSDWRPDGQSPMPYLLDILELRNYKCEDQSEEESTLYHCTGTPKREVNIVGVKMMKMRNNEDGGKVMDGEVEMEVMELEFDDVGNMLFDVDFRG